MKFMFASPPVDEEAIRLEIEKYINFDGLDTKMLQKIHNEKGVNHASVYVRESIGKCSENRTFLDEIEAAEPFAKSHFDMLVIPTMFYKQHPEIGGNGDLFVNIAKRLGIHCETVPVKSLGSISENAAIIREYFEKRQCSKPLWVLSMSKGTADFKRAYLNELSDEQRKSVQGILNVSGMQGGTLLTSARKGRRLKHLLVKSWLKLRGANIDLLKEMHKSHLYSQSSFKQDEKLEIVNVLALPLLCHLRKPLIKSYEYLSQFGPNDGYILTEDALLPTKKNILFWGADHYLRVPEMNVRAEQILNWINGRAAL